MSVDVVMPVRNGGELIDAAVASIAAQTLDDWRLIVVDDGSTDGSPERLRSCADPRVLVVGNRGHGLVDALNTGLDEVRTEFVARMDADDVCAPDRLARQLDAARTAGTVALGTAYEVIDEVGAVLGVQRVPCAPEGVRVALRRTNPFCHGSLLLRTATVRDVGGYRDLFPLAEDYDLVIRLSARGDLANLDEPLYGWRLTAVSSSVRHTRRQLRQAARVRAWARREGLLGAPPLRTRVEDASTAALVWWERLAVPSPDVVLARRRAGLRRGSGQPAEAILDYDEILRRRRFDMMARLRRRRARSLL